MPAKYKQFLEHSIITEENVVEKVQLLYDLLGAEMLGRDGNSVYVAGVRLTGANMEKNQ